MGIIQALLALSSGGVLGATFLKRRYEEMLPLTVMTTILFLFLFYILNILHVGFYILVAIMIGIYGVSIVHFIKNKDKRKEILSNFFTPGLLVFLLFFLVVFLITKDNLVLFYDELRLWGAYPKILFYDGTLQLGTDAYLFATMQSYEPGMPLFQFFFAKCVGFFSEGHLYLSYAILGVSTLLPLTKKITWKKAGLVALMTIIFLILPTFLGSTGYDGMYYYKTLFIDSILGILFGYLLYLASKNILKDKYSFFQFVVGIGTLTLMKDTGIVFSFFASFAAVLNQVIVFRPKKIDKRAKWLWFLKLALPFILMLSIFGGWKIAQKCYKLENMYSNEIKQEEIIDFIDGPNNEQKNIIKSFSNHFFKDQIIVSNYMAAAPFLTYPVLMIFIFICFAAIFFSLQKEKRKSLVIVAINFFVSAAVFTGGILFLYLFSWREVVCYGRYNSPIFMGAFVLIASYFISYLLDDSKKTSRYNYFIYTVAASLIFVYPGRNFGHPYYNVQLTDHQDFEIIQKHVEHNQDKKILLGFQEKQLQDVNAYFYKHHNLFMDLIEVGIKIKSYAILDVPSSYQELLSNISFEYDYFVLIVMEESDLEYYNQMLPEAVTETTVYKIIRDNDIVVSLEQMK